MNILRWILLLPLSGFIALLATFPWHWVLIILFFMGSLISPEANIISIKDCGNALLWCHFIETVERLGQGFLTPFIFILSSYFIAPSKKIFVSKLFALAIAIFMISAIFFEQVILSSILGVNLETLVGHVYSWSSYNVPPGYYYILYPLQIVGIYASLKYIEYVDLEKKNERN